LDKSSKPLAAFLHVALDALTKRLAPAEFQDLLEKCDVDSENEGNMPHSLVTGTQLETCKNYELTAREVKTKNEPKSKHRRFHTKHIR